LADQLKQTFGDRITSVELIKSGGGVFEIVANDQKLFSKKQLGRFPEPGEVEAKIQALVA